MAPFRPSCDISSSPLLHNACGQSHAKRSRLSIAAVISCDSRVGDIPLCPRASRRAWPGTCREERVPHSNGYKRWQVTWRLTFGAAAHSTRQLSAGGRTSLLTRAPSQNRATNVPAALRCLTPPTSTTRGHTYTTSALRLCFWLPPPQVSFSRASLFRPGRGIASYPQLPSQAVRLGGVWRHVFKKRVSLTHFTSRHSTLPFAVLFSCRMDMDMLHSQ
ncbi:hypothetical protein B0T14DRAFT_268911 [Immersiella caudata]|uniref:Uncharacterized protein n=1 Tax=Immersiella caudata TaxID=314043 RepID=A0AA40BXM5_9PEZI|nr:hypothetical protein B0T14DRAFT_268911 [Immersiella caudata]